MCVSSAALPHSGGLDSSGCHTNRKTGDYHCHRAAMPAPENSTEVVKKSKSGICHDSSSPWYGQTIHFTPFETLQECLDSGGRLPKR
ncbi:MAG TPA: YHYH domain-containing protein [Steroidobacteraceae bacterium]|nr:YHYH domain-containing protein [Steroidobacteraceae bacterium]